MNFLVNLFINGYIKNNLSSVVEETLKEVKSKYAPLSLSQEDIINLTRVQIEDSIKVPWYLVPLKKNIINNLRITLQTEIRNQIKN